MEESRSERWLGALAPLWAAWGPILHPGLPASHWAVWPLCLTLSHLYNGDTNGAYFGRVVVR